MLKEIDNVEGVKWTISMSSLVGASVPESMIPKDVKSMLQSGDHELAFICSEYESATPKVNKKINKITKNYDKTSMVIGEAPLMKDLEDVTNIDIQNVNIASIAAIFVIILIIFKSISLPVILVAIIEFAIAVNMAVPYYQGVSLPFVASIVIGTIQLGATVDYAIVYTNRYLKAVNIEWDVDLAEDLDSLPKEVQIPDGMTDTEEISDYLSNLTGFCHRGFGLKET